MGWGTESLDLTTHLTVVVVREDDDLLTSLDYVRI